MTQPSFVRGGTSQSSLASPAIFPQGGVEGGLLRRENEFQLNRRELFGEEGPDRLLVDVVLEAANADLGEIRSILPGVR